MYPGLFDCNHRCLTKPESEWLVGGNAFRNLKAPAPSPQDHSSQAAAPWFSSQDLSRCAVSGSANSHNSSRLESSLEREPARTQCSGFEDQVPTKHFECRSELSTELRKHDHDSAEETRWPSELNEPN